MSRGVTRFLRLAPLLPGLVLSGSLRAQKDIKTTTTGTCSPIVTGGSSQITINCNGLSAAKANQIVALMNRILAERLDLSEVNSKIDQLHSDIGGLNATIKNATMNPLDNVPEPVKALIKQGNVVTTKCTNFERDWSQKRYDNRGLDRQQRSAAMDVVTKPADDIDQKYGQMFARSYAQKLAAENAELHRLMPDAAPIKDPAAGASEQEVSSYNLSLFSLVGRYQNTHQGANNRMVTGAQQLWADCLSLLQSWSSERLSALTSAKQPRFASGLAAQRDQINQDEASQYRLELEPLLVAYRDAVLPKVADYSSGRDYDAVSSTLQLSGVCSDLAHLNAAYTQTIIEEARSAAAKQ